MIPKILHHMSQNGQLSQAEQNCIDSFIKNNPELKIMHWTDDTTAQFIKENYDEKFYDIWTKNTQGNSESRCNLKKWDTARLFILNKLGGIWTDNDCTCLKSLSDIFTYDLAVRKPVYRYAKIYETQYNYEFTPPHSCNAFFACSKNNEIISEIINRIILCYHNNPKAHVGIATGCLLFGDVIQQRINNQTLGNTRLLDHFEFKEGPERLDWIDKSEFEKMMVIHKVNDNTKRYQSFPEKITISEARILSK